VIALVLALAAADLPESQLVTFADGKEVFAPAFRGSWSKSAAECRNQDSIYTFTVKETRLEGYEWESVLLKSTPMIFEGGPKDKGTAYTVVALTAERGESEVGIGKVRLSLVGNELYMSNAEAVPEDKHLTAEFANVRCN
jgi:hypothetical protein